MDRIKIHNFGPIKDIDIELSKLMVFIGSQGVGKSTFAKLLTILSDVYWWANVCNNQNPMSEFKRMGIVNYFTSDTIIEYHRKHCDVNVTYRHGNFNITIGGKTKDEAYDFCKQLIDISTSDNLVSLGYDLEDPQIDKSINANRDFLRANLRCACYIPAERNLAGAISSSLASIVLSNIPLPNTLMEYLSLFERAKNYFSSYDASFLGVEYDKSNGLNCISVLGDNEKHLSLEECSSGIQSALPMLMITDFACEKKSFDTYVIEEPEQNLFPTNQREVLNKLISIVNSYEYSYMVITTHSPYLLSALNVSLLADKLSKANGKNDEVDSIVAPQFRIDSNTVSVFSLGGETYCKSIKDDKTGLVSVNYLDVVSDAIGSDFNRLYHLYLKTLQK